MTNKEFSGLKWDKFKRIISNCFSSLCRFFSNYWIQFWNKIQIKLFWFIISTLFGIFIGLYIANIYADKKINEYIILGGFIRNVEKYDDVKKKDVVVTEIYDIIKRVR